MGGYSRPSGMTEVAGGARRHKSHRGDGSVCQRGDDGGCTPPNMILGLEAEDDVAPIGRRL